jgi:threonine/homoserine/homoserine lactone efflux protein
MTLLQLAGTAFVVGFSGAMMPGPVLTVTITEVPRHGWTTGLLVSLGHGAVELALVAALYLGAAPLISQSSFSKIVGLAGGAILLWMGGQMAIGGVRGSVGLRLDPEGGNAKPSRPAVLGGATTLSNPYWYLWWATVGMAYMVQAMRHGYVGVAFFFSGHLMADVGWYSLVSVVMVLGQRAMNDAVYRALVGVCGLFLTGLGVYFVWFGVTS